MSHLAPLVHRVLNQGDAIAKKDAKLAGNAPVLAVLSAAEDGPAGWLAAGQALARVLLCAQSQGVWASFFNQPIQVDGAWPELRRMVGIQCFPLLVFRLGYADPVGATPRRSVDEVTAIIN